jgi:hypothetical protein
MNLRLRVLALTTIAATGLGVALTAATTVPAAAERVARRDPADVGGASLNDIRRVTVDHRAHKLVVRVRVTDLRRRSQGGPAGLTIRLDTRARRPGPEFGLATGLYRGTDFQLLRMRHGRPVGEPLTCRHDLRLGFASDVVRFEAARSCLGTPRLVRVGVKVTDEFDASHPVTDWLGRRGSYTRWLASA